MKRILIAFSAFLFASFMDAKAQNVSCKMLYTKQSIKEYVIQVSQVCNMLIDLMLSAEGTPLLNNQAQSARTVLTPSTAARTSGAARAETELALAMPSRDRGRRKSRDAHLHTLRREHPFGPQTLFSLSIPALCAGFFDKRSGKAERLTRVVPSGHIYLRNLNKNTNK